MDRSTSRVISCAPSSNASSTSRRNQRAKRRQEGNLLHKKPKATASILRRFEKSFGCEKQDQKEREEHETLLEVYLRAISGSVSKAA